VYVRVPFLSQCALRLKLFASARLLRHAYESWRSHDIAIIELLGLSYFDHNEGDYSTKVMSFSNVYQCYQGIIVAAWVVRLVRMWCNAHMYYLLQKSKKYVYWKKEWDLAWHRAYAHTLQKVQLFPKSRSGTLHFQALLLSLYYNLSPCSNPTCLLSSRNDLLMITVRSSF